MFASLILLALCAPQTLGISADVTGLAPTTRLAVELNVERIHLIEMQTLYQRRHPGLVRQQQRVRSRERALAGMQKMGHTVDQRRVDEVLDELLLRTQAELESARKALERANPRLALLELRLQAIGQVVARRALIE